MRRPRSWLARLASPAVAAMLLLAAPSAANAQAGDIVHEATIGELQDAMARGRVTSVSLVEAYLARIDAYDRRGPMLHSIIRLNPAARAEAAALDRERRAGRVRGPMHGIPIVVKDNFGTRDLPTSGGSIALAELRTNSDADQVRRLREAGAVILGKTNLHELAAGITSVSSMGGQSCNPYDPSRVPGGSSGGTSAAVAASFAAIGWGSDTCGSIRIPASTTNLWGLRPTKGLSSIAGIIPLAHTQDVAGPLARTVRDLAIGLDATIGADPGDPATRILAGKPMPQFVASLDTAALRGKRIGVLGAHFGDAPEDVEVTAIVRAALDSLRAQGATLVEVQLPDLDTLIARAGVIDFEFAPDLRAFLAATPAPPVRTLTEILERGLYHSALEATFRRRALRASSTGPEYEAALSRRILARAMIEQVLDAQRLDAIAYPTLRRRPAMIGDVQRGANCQLSAVTGLPALGMPAGFTSDSLPVGMELLGRSLSDAHLVAMAYDYETAVAPRRAPRHTPPLSRSRAPAGQTYRAFFAARGISVQATFSPAAADGLLAYTIDMTGIPRDGVLAITLARDTAGLPGAIVTRLVGVAPANGRLRGSVRFGAAEQLDLEANRLWLTVHRGDSATPISARVTPTRRGR